MSNQDIDVLLIQLHGSLDLITRTDAWLEREKISLSASIDEKVRELEKILLAMRIKIKLQQTNSVAIIQTTTQHSGIQDQVVRIMSLPQALELHKHDPNGSPWLENTQRFKADGYDVDLVEWLRQHDL